MDGVTNLSGNKRLWVIPLNENTILLQIILLLHNRNIGLSKTFNYYSQKINGRTSVLQTEVRICKYSCVRGQKRVREEEKREWGRIGN